MYLSLMIDQGVVYLLTQRVVVVHGCLQCSKSCLQLFHLAPVLVLRLPQTVRPVVVPLFYLKQVKFKCGKVKVSGVRCQVSV